MTNALEIMEAGLVTFPIRLVYESDSKSYFNLSAMRPKQNLHEISWINI